MDEVKRLPWSDSGGFSCVHYLDAYKQILGEWAFVTNFVAPKSFVYGTNNRNTIYSSP